MNATHFIVQYNVPCYSPRDGVRRIDICSSGVREMRHLLPFLKCCESENVAVFKIKAKNQQPA
jgi:hypothetical protein